MIRYYKSYFTIFLLVIIVSLFSSCQKPEHDLIPASNIQRFQDIQAPDGFQWSAIRKITVIVEDHLSGQGSLMSRVSVFSGTPDQPRNRIASGSITASRSFQMDINIPGQTTGLWIEITRPDGNRELAYQPIVSERITYMAGRQKKSAPTKSGLSLNGCSSGCDEIVQGNTPILISGGKTICITGDFCGTITFDPAGGGGRLRICGSASPSSISFFGDQCHIEVSETGSISLNRLSMTQSATLTFWPGSQATIGSVDIMNPEGKVTNYSEDLTIQNDVFLAGTIENYGTCTITGNLTTGSGSSIISSGNITIGGSFVEEGALTNMGPMFISGNIEVNSVKNMVNSCQIVVSQNFSLSNGLFILNGGYLSVAGTTSTTGTGDFNLQNQSMISAADFSLSGSLSASGIKNLVKTTGNASLSAGSMVSGHVEWVTPSGFLTSGQPNQFSSGAALLSAVQSTTIIPAGDCNPEGFGSASPIDSDSDGVPDHSDDFPMDGTRAFNNYFPADSSWATFAFEDLWPSAGDFDMNDLVVHVRFNRITNALNQLVEVANQYKIIAMGGSFKSGFGLQLDNLQKEEILSVTGSVIKPGGDIQLDASGLESGTDRPVIIIWDNPEPLIHRTTGRYFNTDPDGGNGTSEEVMIRIVLRKPQTFSALGSIPFNHFLIKNGNRGYEIHLPGTSPTSRANASVFGTYMDDSQPSSGKYYLSQNNLPWGIFIPVEFQYPLEKTDIVQVYNHFSAWAQSGGLLYSDWYLNLPGYRNEELVY
jgi:LruC domain-containing protein